ncbi:hotdog fold thioesterase [Mycobacterium sp. Marseille-P9652]|uniref:hotdog fold thioesterase n=1 Tax=Mycobacterium sp. Marseille-P9652 TaxID=2654950 RepID=UPI0012E84BAB|nr:hotdog fold thioesterase [Mycobacterium sp. Marseille-P9652]
MANASDEAVDEARDGAEVTRGDRFIKTAVEILGETGRTDFTVQEVVARSKTSLRAFYQHFSSKDELLMALFDRTIAQSAKTWRAQTAGLDSTAALKLVIDRVSQQPASSTQDSLNRALTLYNQHLAETRPREYARVLSPLHQLIRDIVGQGITEGVFDPGLDVGAAAAIVMQTVMGAQRLHWLGAELNGTPLDAGQLYDFCSRALGIRDTRDKDEESAAPSLSELFAQIGMRPGTRDGEFAMTMPVSPQVVNTSGALQGGLIATLVDVAGGQFGLEHLRPGTTMTTADLFIRYLRPIRQGAAFAVPRMLRAGRRAMVMQVDIYGDGDDELLATATVNFAIINGKTPELPSWPGA